MRTMTVLLAACVVAAAASAVTSAQAAPKFQTGNNAVITSGGGVLAPSGPQTNATSNQATLPATFAPLTAEECTGLGGKVHVDMLCAINGHKACSTVDANGVVRKVCLTQ